MEALGCFMAMLSFLADTDLTTTPLAITTPLADADTQTQHRSGHTLSNTHIEALATREIAQQGTKDLRLGRVPLSDLCVVLWCHM